MRLVDKIRAMHVPRVGAGDVDPPLTPTQRQYLDDFTDYLRSVGTDRKRARARMQMGCERMLREVGVEDRTDRRPLP